jgi:hypothetical protein
MHQLDFIFFFSNNFYVDCDKTQITETNSCPTLGTKGNNYGQNTENVSESAIEYDSPKKSTSGNTTIQESDTTVNKGFNYPQQSSRVNDRKLDINNEDVHHLHHGIEPEMPDGANVGTIVGILMSIGLLSSAVLWIFYAYRNPHTKSGQLLIQVS